MLKTVFSVPNSVVPSAVRGSLSTCASVRGPQMVQRRSVLHDISKGVNWVQNPIGGLFFCSLSQLCGRGFLPLKSTFHHRLFSKTISLLQSCTSSRRCSRFPVVRELMFQVPPTTRTAELDGRRSPLDSGHTGMVWAAMTAPHARCCWHGRCGHSHRTDEMVATKREPAPRWMAIPRCSTSARTACRHKYNEGTGPLPLRVRGSTRVRSGNECHRRDHACGEQCSR